MSDCREKLKRANTERLQKIAQKAGIEASADRTTLIEAILHNYETNKVIQQYVTEMENAAGSYGSMDNGHSGSTTGSTGPPSLPIASGVGHSGSTAGSTGPPSLQRTTTSSSIPPPRQHVPNPQQQVLEPQAFQQVVMNQNDLNNGVRKFSGDDNLLVAVWINTFEEFIELMGWTPIQALVAAKRSLTSTALLVSQLSFSRSWDAL